jgi:hypothetical protein
VHNKIEYEKHVLRTVVLIKVLVDTHATGCKTQQLTMIDFQRNGQRYIPKDIALLTLLRDPQIL